MFITPTLKDAVAGDLALVLPHRIIVNILEGLEQLDKMSKEIDDDDTLEQDLFELIDSMYDDRKEA